MAQVEEEELTVKLQTAGFLLREVNYITNPATLRKSSKICYTCFVSKFRCAVYTTLVWLSLPEEEAAKRRLIEIRQQALLSKLH
jgi:hypothetical protein